MTRGTEDIIIREGAGCLGPHGAAVEDPDRSVRGHPQELDVGFGVLPADGGAWSLLALDGFQDPLPDAGRSIVPFPGFVFPGENTFEGAVGCENAHFILVAWNGHHHPAVVSDIEAAVGAVDELFLVQLQFSQLDRHGGGGEGLVAQAFGRQVAEKSLSRDDALDLVDMLFGAAGHHVATALTQPPHDVESALGGVAHGPGPCRGVVQVQLDHLAGKGLQHSDGAVGQETHVGRSPEFTGTVALAAERVDQFPLGRKDTDFRKLGIEQVDVVIVVDQDLVDDPEHGFLVVFAPDLPEFLEMHRLPAARRLGSVDHVKNAVLHHFLAGNRRQGHDHHQQKGKEAPGR